MADQNQNTDSKPGPSKGKNPGNPKMRQLREQNQELAASNKKLRENLEDFKRRLKAQRNKADLAASEVEELKAIIERKDAELAHKDNVIVMVQTESDRVKAEVHSYATSTSWKITSPLRAVINIFK